MKKRDSILGVVLFLASLLRGQTIDNAGFDSLYIGAIDRIRYWITSDIYPIREDTVVTLLPSRRYESLAGPEHMAFNTVSINYDDPDSPRYLKSVKLFTKPHLRYPDGKPFRGFIVNGNHCFTDENGFIDFKKGGAPFPFRPSHLSGYYKFEAPESPAGDFGKAIVLLKKYNRTTRTIDTIGYAESKTELAPGAEWASFELPIRYLSSAIPDSIVVLFFSSTEAKGPTTLWLDELFFQYETTARNPFPSAARDTLYPNPTSGKVFLSTEDNRQKEFKLFDAKGALIKSGICIKEIDFSLLENGLYLLLISQGQMGGRVYKVLKQ